MSTSRPATDVETTGLILASRIGLILGSAAVVQADLQPISFKSDRLLDVGRRHFAQALRASRSPRNKH